MGSTRTSWQPGQSGNRRGRPKRGAALAAWLRYELSQVSGEDGQTTRGAELARVLVQLALGGDVQAIKVILDRIDGPVANVVTGPDAGPIQLVWLDRGDA